MSVYPVVSAALIRQRTEISQHSHVQQIALCEK